MKSFNETYDFENPDSSLHNIVIGKPYLWHNGKLSTTCRSSGITAEVKFLEKGWTSKNDYKITGNVKDKDGNIIMKLSGSWIESLKAVDLRDKKEYILAEKYKLPENSNK